MAEVDVTPPHLSWIVEGRSFNQQSTLALYKLIFENERTLNGSPAHHEASQELTGVGFSLWRAVFLSDTTGEFADQLADVKRFLLSLISDNVVLYNTDKNSRNWSFRNYVDNAIYRLQKLSASPLQIVDADDFSKPVASEKHEWINAQAVFDRAVKRFGEALRASPES